MTQLHRYCQSSLAAFLHSHLGQTPTNDPGPQKDKTKMNKVSSLAPHQDSDPRAMAENSPSFISLLASLPRTEAQVELKTIL